MLQSGKYDLVHEFFRKMAKSGEAIGALTYKVLVRAFWEEGKINEAVAAVRNMEQRGVVGTASVYYELACCLCNNGRWQDAMLVVEKIKSLRHSKPLEITFTGLIISSMDGGHIDDCISIFQHMKDHCEPNIGTVNAMLKVYSRNDMFSKAKELFEETTRANSSGYTFLSGDGAPLKPDEYTYSSMLEASATAHQWEYFEYVYKGMALSGCQLDQTKHAWLLVEASRAGKCHLLEHAFDSLLEAGEIPHPLFFTEMLIQAIVQSNYEKAVALINAMAYAPFHITERQWTELFESNEDRISRDKLEKLLNALCNCNAASSEITVSNLSRALHALCQSEKERDLSSSAHFGSQAIDISPLHGIHEAFDVKETENVPSSSASMMFENADLGADPLPQKTDVAVDIDSINHSSLSRQADADTEMFSKALSYIHSNDRPSNLCIDMEGLADDWASSEHSDYLDEELAALYLSKQSQDNDVVDLQKSMNRVGGSQRSKLPSASEILESWKESREKDGIFFPFEHGKKSL